MEKTQTCSWCHKDVAEENFALHEMHCSRFLSLCPDCGETVPSELMEQHREEQHTQVRCSKCKQKMERCHLEDHEENECVERLQICVYCDLELPWKLVDEHRSACGSRTERCLDCDLYVKLSDQHQHHISCSASKDESESLKPDHRERELELDGGESETPVTCRICRELFPAEEMYEHELKCCEASGQKDSDGASRLGASRLGASRLGVSRLGASRLGVRPRTDSVDPAQIGSCPHCDLTLPLHTLSWHQAKCQLYSQC